MRNDQLAVDLSFLLLLASCPLKPPKYSQSYHSLTPPSFPLQLSETSFPIFFIFSILFLVDSGDYFLHPKLLAVSSTKFTSKLNSRPIDFALHVLLRRVNVCRFWVLGGEDPNQVQTTYRLPSYHQLASSLSNFIYYLFCYYLIQNQFWWWHLLRN